MLHIPGFLAFFSSQNSTSGRNNGERNGLLEGYSSRQCAFDDPQRCANLRWLTDGCEHNRKYGLTMSWLFSVMRAAFKLGRHEWFALQRLITNSRNSALSRGLWNRSLKETSQVDGRTKNRIMKRPLHGTCFVLVFPLQLFLCWKFRNFLFRNKALVYLFMFLQHFLRGKFRNMFTEWSTCLLYFYVITCRCYRRWLVDVFQRHLNTVKSTLNCREHPGLAKSNAFVVRKTFPST